MGDAAPAAADGRDVSTRKRSRPKLPSSLSAAAAAADGSGLRRVAEIVMVLSAMGRMRGGRDPTPAERKLAAEARELLAVACEGVRPKDLFTKEAVRVVVEDLGLNRASGDIRPSRISIAEKLLLTKRKMEGPKESPTQPSAYPPNHQSTVFAASESRGAMTHGASRCLQDKSSVMVLPAGGVHGATSVTLASATTSKQAPHSHAGPNPVSPSSISQSMQSYSEASHLRMDGRAHVQASQGFVSRQAPIVSSVQSAYVAASAPPVKYGQLNKMLDHAPINSEGNPGVHPVQTAQQAMSNHEIKHPNFQTGTGATLAGHQPSHGLAYADSSSVMNNHNDIAKNLQQVLQSKVSVHANWTQPSIEYMNKPLNCQICTIFITDVESLLVCDACERGYHLKCLQSYGNKGLSKQEWHCQRCLSASHGKPLPPKYGRVTRAPPTQHQKVSPSAFNSQVPPVKKHENPDNFSQPKASANGYSSLPQDTNSFNMGGNPCSPSILDSRTSGAAIQSSNPVIEIRKEGTCSGTESMHSSGKDDDFCTATGRQSESSGHDVVSQCDMKSTSEFISHSNVVVEITSEHLSQKVESINPPQTTCASQITYEVKSLSSSEASAPQQHDMTNSCSNELKELHPGTKTSGSMDSNDARSDEPNKVQVAPNGAMDLHGNTSGHGKSVKLDSGNVEWVGNVVQVEEEKEYYRSCQVNNLLHRLYDNALVTLDSDKFIPAKIQSLWEDKSSGSKWATVNTYLFPSDLQEDCNPPSKPADSEVYASNNCKTIMAGLISGPCEVLPHDMFMEENDKRRRLGDADNNLHPIFMCNWIYDESTCNFQPLTD